MKKTGSLILNDVYELVRDSALAGFVGGGVYKNRRPDGSVAEDIVLTFQEGEDGQYQTGIVEIDIYVTDTDNGSGQKAMDSERCAAIEAKLAETVERFTSSEYLFSLEKLIQTFEEPQIEQHFIAADLRFKKATVMY